MILNREHVHVFRDRMDPFGVNNELLNHYRFTKHVILQIAEMRKDCESQTQRNHFIPSTSLYRCCIALNFHATGALYSSLENKFEAARSSISRIIHCVSKLKRKVWDDYNVIIDFILFHFISIIYYFVST